MTDDTIKKSDFKGVAAIASVVAGLLILGAGWDAMKKAIVAELESAVVRIEDQQEKDMAAMRLQIACSWNATLEPAERQLPVFIYCVQGKTSKDRVVK